MLSDAPGARAVIIATGSEVSLALEAQKQLAAAGIAGAGGVDALDQRFRPPGRRVPELGAAARHSQRSRSRPASRDYWRKYVGPGGRGGRHRPLRRVGPGRRPVQALRLHPGERRQSRQEHRQDDQGSHQRIRPHRPQDPARPLRGRQEARPAVRRHQRPGRRADQRAPPQVRHGARAFPGNVRVDGDSIVVNDDRIKVVAERDPAKLPWKSLGVDVVLECTGLFTSKAKAGAHLQAGAKKVIISAPGDKDVDRTVVFGRQPPVAQGVDTVISNASCTTNCLAPLVKALDDRIGVSSGLMNTIHSFTNDQVLTDVYHRDLRRARAAGHNMIPTKTGAAAAVGPGAAAPERQARRLLDPRADHQRLDRRPDLRGEEADHGRRGEQGGEAGVRRRAEGHPRVHDRAAGVVGLQPQPGQLDLRRRPDAGVRRHAGQGVLLVRQRVGLLQPHARRHRGLRARSAPPWRSR